MRWPRIDRGLLAGMPVARRIVSVAVVCASVVSAGGSAGPTDPTSATSPVPPVMALKTRPSAVECGGVRFEGEVATLTELPDGRVQDAINSDLTASLCDWGKERQREMEGYGLDLPGFGLGSIVHHLDHHLYSVEVRTATISDRQAHPAEGVLTFNYALADGARIELPDLFLPYEFTLAEAIAAAVGPDGYTAAADALQFDAFLVDDRGIEFVFPPCRLDACAAGYISVSVPYPDLAGLVDPDGVAAPYL